MDTLSSVCTTTKICPSILHRLPALAVQTNQDNQIQFNNIIYPEVSYFSYNKYIAYISYAYHYTSIYNLINNTELFTSHVLGIHNQWITY